MSRKNSTKIELSHLASPRDAILHAALRLLRAEGASGLSLRTITAEAGCSTTGVYTWFGGKDGLVEAIFVDGFTRFGDALRESVSGANGLADLMGQAMAYRTWALANPTHYKVMFGGLVPNFVPSPAAVGVSLQTFVMLSDNVARAQAEGSLAPGDPAEIAKHLWAAIHGYVSLEFAMDHTGVDERETFPKAPMDEQYERGLQRLVEGIRAPRG